MPLPCCRRGCTEDAAEFLLIEKEDEEIELIVCRTHSAQEKTRYGIYVKMTVIPLEALTSN